MRTINEVCETCKAVFEWKRVLFKGYELTSDRVNWIVNNIPIDILPEGMQDFSELIKFNTTIGVQSEVIK